MPRQVLVTVVVLCVVAALLGLRAGWRYATITETEVIDAAAADYLAHAAAEGHEVSVTDCAARPGQGKVWVIVLCVPQSDTDARRTEYYISRWGRMEKFLGG